MNFSKLLYLYRPVDRIYRHENVYTNTKYSSFHFVFLSIALGLKLRTILIISIVTNKRYKTLYLPECSDKKV